MRTKREARRVEIKELKSRIQRLEDEARANEARIRVFEKQTNPERKRIIMVKKPIFDADGNQIGEGLVEQIVTLRTDESIGALAAGYMSQYGKSEFGEEEASDISLNSEDLEKLDTFLKE